MTQKTYIPSEGDIRRAYASYTTLNGVHAGSVVARRLLSEGNGMEFDRWLAAHDAEVRDKALTLTEDELAIAEGAYESSITEYEGDGLGAMSVALKTVAEDRRSHEYRNG